MVLSLRRGSPGMRAEKGLHINNRGTKEEGREQAKIREKEKGNSEEIQLWLQTLKNVPGDR